MEEVIIPCYFFLAIHQKKENKNFSLIKPIAIIASPIKRRTDPTPMISAMPPAIRIGNNEKTPIKAKSSP